MFPLLKQSILASLASLRINKGRSFLTMLGIIIGVASVIMIMSVGAGAQSLILSQVETLGSDKIGILPGKAEEGEPPASVMGIVITSLTYEDAKAIEKEIPNVENVVVYNNGVGNISWRSNTYQTNIKGCNSSYPEVEGGELESGRFFTEREEQDLSRVAVLGSTVKQQLFGESQATGQTIKIKGHIFSVIGTMKERGTVAFQDYDDQILIPVRTMQRLITGVHHVNMIRADVHNRDEIKETIKDIEFLLRQRHNIESPANDDFTVRSSEEAMEIVEVITDSLKYFLAAMAALSLLVGGIGIMNIMLVNVNERTREIGLRKAIGANNSNIISQFLAETMVLTIAGGIIGIIIGAAVSFLAYLAVTQGLGYHWEFSVTISSILLGVSISALIGIVFGSYPAFKASKLSPVEALRYE
jgi:ABC-type antimicrobial peptide transport system permease subunit